MTQHAWEIARTAKMAGVVTRMHFDPSRLTARIRKAAQRMLRTGMLKGGWSSQSRKVAELVATHHKLPMIKTSGNYLYVDRRTLTRGDMDEIARLVHADITTFKLEGEVPRWYLERGSANEYIQEQIMRQLTNLDAFDRCQAHYIHFLDQAFAKQAAEIITERHRQEFAELCERAAAYLDSSQCIPIPEFN